MNPFRSLRDYELYIYSLQRSESRITRSTLVVAQRGRLFAELTGDVTLMGGCRLSVYAVSYTHLTLPTSDLV